MLNVCYHTYVNHAFLNICLTYGLISHVCNVCLTYVVRVLSSNICETYVAQLAVYYLNQFTKFSKYVFFPQIVAYV